MQLFGKIVEVEGSLDDSFAELEQYRVNDYFLN
jgi:hypothetical protein